MRSCSSLVLVQETAKQVTPVHQLWTILGGGPWTGWIWRLQPQRPVRAMSVVVLHVDPQDLIQMPLPDDQQPVHALGTHRANPTFRVAFALGACTGATTTSAPSERNTSSKLRHNFVSRSRMRKRRRRPHSQGEQQVARLPGGPGTVGLAVTPARWIRRWPARGRTAHTAA
jgi:hypothetical protein